MDQLLAKGGLNPVFMHPDDHTQPPAENSQPKPALKDVCFAAGFPPSCAKGLGTFFILLAVIAVIGNIGWLFVSESYAYIGVGFWASGPVFLAGLLLVISAFRPHKCLYVMALIMSITGVLSSFAFFTVSSLELIVNNSTQPVNGSSVTNSSTSDFNQSQHVAIWILFFSIGVFDFCFMLFISIMLCALLSRKT